LNSHFEARLFEGVSIRDYFGNESYLTTPFECIAYPLPCSNAELKDLQIYELCFECEGKECFSSSS